MVNEQDEQVPGKVYGPVRPGAPRPEEDAERLGDAEQADDETPAPPSTDQLRISAIQAAVAAGLAPSTGRASAPSPEVPTEVASPALPDWTDPPTGQVPRVLRDLEAPGEGSTLAAPVRGPTWRQDAGDWDDDLGLGFLVDEQENAEEAGLIAGRGPDTGEVRPFDFGFDQLDLPRHPGHPAPEASLGNDERDLVHHAPVAALEPRPAMAPPSGEEIGEEEAAWAALLGDEAAAADPVEERELLGAARFGARRRSGAHRKARRAVPRPRADAPAAGLAEPPLGNGALGNGVTTSAPVAQPARAERRVPSERSGRRPTSAAPPVARGRNAVVATITGVAFGLAALACFLLGQVATLVLVTLALTVAAGEAYGTLRSTGRRPATLIGLVAVPLLVVGAYLWGAVAVPAVLAGALVLGTVWSLAVGSRAPGELRPGTVQDLASTLLVACWVGVLGSFAGLLLAPSTFPHRHGVAFVVGIVAVTVAHDVGCYAVGAKLGRHRMAPRVSPNKTWEGIAGGTVLAFLVAGLVLTHIHPFNLAVALALAALVAVLGPLGDLAESLLKRELGVKDMGRLLPEHGGLFDRVDAMLYVLPAAYLLFRAAHLQ